MKFPRRLFLLLLLAGLQMRGVLAADLTWAGLDGLQLGDRQLAETALADMFGEDPELWPDWIDPAGVLVPTANRDGGNFLVVREPYRMACGQYMFIIFAPVGSDGTRSRLGEGFCGGSLAVQPVKGLRLPDLLLSEGRQRDETTEDGWRRVDQRLRWTGKGWVRILP